jgi:drug/metabolite transporter (DMT)-like permease
MRLFLDGRADLILEDQSFGIFFILLSCLMWALYTIFARPALKNMSALKMAALTNILGTVFYLLLPGKTSPRRILPGCRWAAGLEFFTQLCCSRSGFYHLVQIN